MSIAFSDWQIKGKNMQLKKNILKDKKYSRLNRIIYYISGLIFLGIGIYYKVFILGLAGACLLIVGFFYDRTPSGSYEEEPEGEEEAIPSDFDEDYDDIIKGKIKTTKNTSSLEETNQVEADIDEDAQDEEEEED